MSGWSDMVHYHIKHLGWVFSFLKLILLTNVCQVSLLIGWSRNGTLLLKSVPFRDHTIKKHMSHGFLNIL